jgi:hypothetical protein
VDRLAHDWRIHSREIQETGQQFYENLDPSMTFQRETNGTWQTFQVVIVMNRSVLSICRNRTVKIASSLELGFVSGRANDGFASLV